MGKKQTSEPSLPILLKVSHILCFSYIWSYVRIMMQKLSSALILVKASLCLISQIIKKPVCHFYTIFIFANLQSGGKLGRKIKNAQVKSIELTEVSNTCLHFYIINEEKSRKAGLKYLRTLSEELDMNSNRLVALAGGGDGTVNWLLAELIAAEIDFDKVIFGAFPLGTGNDFAKNLGWKEYSIFDNNFYELHNFVLEIQNAIIEEFNVWDAEVFAHQTKGYIVKEKHVDGMIIMVNEQSEPTRSHVLKRFTNYFSFGMDARVGYDFNRHRSQKQLLNYALYAFIGCFNKLRHIKNIQDIVSKMSLIDEEVGPNGIITKRQQIVFTQQSAANSHQKYKNIVAHNINFYMGGVSNIWKYSYRTGANIIQQEKVFKQNSHSDGLLEWFSFKHEWSLGFERICRGRARKMAQATGPFKIQFRPDCELTYLNFDGEYYKVVRPKEIIVRRSSYFEKARLRVLRRRTQ